MPEEHSPVSGNADWRILCRGLQRKIFLYYWKSHKQNQHQKGTSDRQSLKYRMSTQATDGKPLILSQRTHSAFLGDRPWQGTSTGQGPDKGADTDSAVTPSPPKRWRSRRTCPRTPEHGSQQASCHPQDQTHTRPTKRGHHCPWLGPRKKGLGLSFTTCLVSPATLTHRPHHIPGMPRVNTGMLGLMFHIKMLGFKICL